MFTELSSRIDRRRAWPRFTFWAGWCVVFWRMDLAWGGGGKTEKFPYMKHERECVFMGFLGPFGLFATAVVDGLGTTGDFQGRVRFARAGFFRFEVQMTLNETEQKIYNALKAYQNGRHEQNPIGFQDLTTPLTGLFFSLVGVLERGQDELPREANLFAQYHAGFKAGAADAKAIADCPPRHVYEAGIKAGHAEPKPEPIRMSAANQSEISKAYITGTKDGLAVASRLVDQTLSYQAHLLGELVEAYKGTDLQDRLSSAFQRKTEVLNLRGILAKALAEETNRTEKAQEGK